MGDRERKNDYLTVDDLIWALGFESRPAEPVPSKDDSDDVDSDEPAPASDEPAPAPDEEPSPSPDEAASASASDAPDEPAPTEAITSPEEQSPLDSTSENEESTPKETILGFHMKNRSASANKKEADPEPPNDVTKPIARILDSIPVMAAAKDNPYPLPSYIDPSYTEPSTQSQSTPLNDATTRLYEDLWGGAHPASVPSDDVAATLPSQRQRVYISTPNHQPVTAKKAAWTVLERPTRTSVSSQFATAYDPTAEMPPILFSEKPKLTEEPKAPKDKEAPAEVLNLEEPRWPDAHEERAKRDQSKNPEGSAGAGKPEKPEKPDGAEKPAASDKPNDTEEPPPKDEPAAPNVPNAPDTPNTPNAPDSQEEIKKPPPRSHIWMLVASAIFCAIAILSLIMAFVVMEV